MGQTSWDQVDQAQSRFLSSNPTVVSLDQSSVLQSGPDGADDGRTDHLFPASVSSQCFQPVSVNNSISCNGFSANV